MELVNNGAWVLPAALMTVLVVLLALFIGSVAINLAGTRPQTTCTRSSLPPVETVRG